MMKTATHTLHGQKLILSHLRGMYWENEKTLLVADSHLGKVGHFQKAGIPVPPAVLEQDLLRLSDLITEFTPKRLVILGDLFHSTYNSDWEFFRVWREQFRTTKMVLIQGNHDILPSEQYCNLDIELIPDYLSEGPFYFSHKPATAEVPGDVAVICGHVHPAVELKGAAKQSMRLPCFYFGASHVILPAFSEFTGMATIHPNKVDAIYALTDKGIHTIA